MNKIIKFNQLLVIVNWKTEWISDCFPNKNSEIITLIKTYGHEDAFYIADRVSGLIEKRNQQFTVVLRDGDKEIETKKMKIKVNKIIYVFLFTKQLSFSPKNKTRRNKKLKTSTHEIIHMPSWQPHDADDAWYM